MEFKSEVKEALLKIEFGKRAKRLTENHFENSYNTFGDYDNEEVIKIFRELGYDVKYDKRENFFKVTEKLIQYKLQCHICLKYGHVELGWYLLKDNKYYDGYVWGVMKNILEGNDEHLMRPEFHSYEELKEILKEAFLMYEDFKKELCSIS